MEGIEKVREQMDKEGWKRERDSREGSVRMLREICKVTDRETERGRE